MPVGGRTIALEVTGPILLLTADTNIPIYEAHNSYSDAGYAVPVGKVTVTPVLPSGVAMPPCVVVGVNVTEQAVSGCNLTAAVGQELVFELEITGGALLYTIGFGHGA
jgi:hypothetical protein